MDDKKKISLTQYIISLLVVSCLSILVTMIVYQHNEMVKKSQPKSKDLAKVENLYDEITTNYMGEVSRNKLINGALKGMTSALDDPYSEYMNKDEARKLNDTLSSRFEGIGVSLNYEAGRPVLQTPTKDSPAAKAGLKAKDIILKIDEKDTKDRSLKEIVQQIRGKRGTQVTLTIQRDDQPAFSVTLTRDVIPIRSVNTSLDSEHPQIGNIQLARFSDNTFTELKTAIKNLRKEGAQSFIIDVRQNPGGSLEQAEKVASMFLENGKTIVKFKNRKGTVTTKKAGKRLDGGFKVNEPVVVLIDGGSASAAEILAAALQESAAIKTIGSQTFGKGTVQNVSELAEDTELKLTVSKWLTPHGKWLQHKGICPTIKVDYPNYKYLKRLPINSRLSEGMESGSVRNLQQILLALGYQIGSPSGYYNAETTKAIQSFQQANGMSATGVVDKLTAIKLEAQLADLIAENDPVYQKAIAELISKQHSAD